VNAGTPTRAVAGVPGGLCPDWSPPAGVGCVVTTRVGGVSRGPFGAADGASTGLNLGAHVGDDPAAVSINRARLAAGLPAPVRWLEQVHGTDVHDADADDPAVPPRADASVTTRSDVVLASGVAEATVTAMRSRTQGSRRVVAWLGPAIGPAAFEVGTEVRDAFCDVDPAAAHAFERGRSPGKWQADLARLARQRLGRVEVSDIGGGSLCTFADPSRFWSHRRDGRGGRMASLIWIGRRAG
jgi:hypothetical protein